MFPLLARKYLAAPWCLCAVSLALVPVAGSLAHAQEAGPSAPAPAMEPEPRLRDEAGEVLQQALQQQKEGRHAEAVVLFERALAAPVPAGARPPGMLPGPVDWRGEARWGIAESLRAQGKWTRALELYRLNRAEYPRSDGCVPSGGAFQEMALAEAACLEHLGRPQEAVQVLWPASLNLSASNVPRAARRLADLYAASGQTAVLEAALAREERVFLEHTESHTTGRRWASPAATDADRANIERQRQYSALPSFKRVLWARGAARQGKWSVLLQALSVAEPQGDLLDDQFVLRREAAQWRRREVFAALAMAAPKATTPLRAALARDAENVYLQAALLICTAPREEQQALASYSSDSGRNTNRGIREALADFVGYAHVPFHFPPLPQKVRLPESLPAFFGPRSQL